MTDKIKPVTNILTLTGIAKNGLPICTLWEGKPSPETEQRFLPVMTWADWELLQELHKARNGEGTATIQFAPVEIKVEDKFPGTLTSYDKQYESLARHGAKHMAEIGGSNPAGSMSTAAVEAIAKIGGGGAPEFQAGLREVNWQAVAADLQDQIKDWETVNRSLEQRIEQKDTVIKKLGEELDKLQGSLTVAVQIKDNFMRENAELSKSLQHYRSAYYADQGNKEDPSIAH